MLQRSNLKCMEKYKTSIAKIQRLGSFGYKFLSRSRLMRELGDAHKLDDPNIRLTLCNNNILHWIAYIRGPENSPYEEGIFVLNITCPPDYPINPPTVSFETRCFHPNINFQTGEVCMDVLKSNWSPAWTLSYLCRGIIYILSDPNADSPLNCDAGNLLRSGDVLGFNTLARMYTIDEALEEFPI
ncbi:bifunctional Ubiquitin-conjugating enzyme E2/Ubiquitin-conjugating enzyme-RWD-like [Babesia duncani]|uniref:Bifunctional Ubiquitin-conjugating enzyme E2/Ubiquitin-conjugating enzyme-RWD-like n=1 Tax=Babesia duncani TaxID=323732 RepID=A0AAD9PIA3_9APIC|nr:bifunctional Ubiquitin-conjugating enzyme E2/Ubiquitin-conjugating enzyme-RWD-like [Babesia duncani]